MRVHISINSTAIDQSVDFYSSFFGQEASKTRNGYANFRLDEPPIHLALVEKPASPGGGVSHLGIELPDADALENWRSRLEASNLDFEVEDEARCCYAQANKLWVTDPDGYRWEIWVRTGEYEAI